MSGMEVVGLVAAVIPLVTIATDLYHSIRRLRLNPQRRNYLTKLVDDLVKILKTASATSSAAEELVRSALQEVKSALESLSEARKMRYVPKFFSRWIAAPGEAAKLDEVERKLESLTTQVVVVQSIFQLKEELPRVFNERMELPECVVGLDRVKNVLDFLQISAGERLRVVGIHGVPGLGKTTLLNCIWNKASSTAPFAARAHIQIGQSINDLQVCTLQSIMLQQLGGEQNVKFTAPEGGKGKLSEHLQQLKHNRKPIFLAIDNVFEVEDLTKLLPATLSKDIPVSSVIAITCRRLTIVKALLNICDLHQDNGSQVYLFNPDFLKLAESKAVFAACGGLSNDADAELLESLVPLCGGLPLALTVLGKLFAGGARRSREEWELVKEQMEKLDGDDTETQPVAKALQVSYNQLSESCKAAFCEVVICFYGWKWERVERILSVKVLKDLKESSLISEADDWYKCNQSALREGYDMDEEWDINEVPRVVTMHDLTLKFGEGLRTNHSVVTRTDSQFTRGLFQHLEIPKLKDLILWRGSVEGDSELEFLEKAASLRTLFLHRSFLNCNFVLKASFYTQNLARNGPQPLLFLRLERCISSRSIMEMKLSCEVREIHLHDCNDVEQLPDMSLHKLEVLSIFGCQNFQYFSPSSVRRWCKLKYLEVVRCERLTSVSAELGRLENLSNLRIEGCGSLQTLPTMSCPLQRLHLVQLPIANLNLEETACSHLREVHLSGCNFEVLPSLGWNALSLQTMQGIELFSPEYYAGCAVGGMLACGITHLAVTPVDVVKCNIQIDPVKYKGTFGAAQTIIREQGLRGLARGWAPTFVGYSAQGAGKYGLYEVFKKYYTDLAGPELGKKYKTGLYLAGSASAELIADVALCPFEAVKVRVQTQPGFARGLADGLPKLISTEGIGGVYKGIWALWGRQVPYTMMKFATFENTVEAFYTHIIPHPKQECSVFTQLGVSFASGYIAGIACAVVSHPADNLVSYLNNAKGATVGQAVKQMGVWNLCTRGLPLRIVMIGTLTAAQWSIYDSFKVFLGIPTTGGAKVEKPLSLLDSSPTPIAN